MRQSRHSRRAGLVKIRNRFAFSSFKQCSTFVYCFVVMQCMHQRKARLKNQDRFDLNCQNCHHAKRTAYTCIDRVALTRKKSCFVMCAPLHVFCDRMQTLHVTISDISSVTSFPSRVVLQAILAVALLRGSGGRFTGLVGTAASGEREGVWT